MIEKTRHLCTHCLYAFPTCNASTKDIKFGNGIGNDNVYECEKFLLGHEWFGENK